MKNNTIANRFAALALCFVLLFAAAPLPQAFAAPEDETGTSDTNYTEDGSEDTGEDTGGEEGDGTDASAAQHHQCHRRRGKRPGDQRGSRAAHQPGLRHGAV